MYLNKVMLYGNLTRDPETKALPSGQSVTNFSVATNRTYKDKDGSQKEQVEYHSCVAFGKVAEIIGQYMKKGKPILVDGRLQTRSWEKDGAKQYRTEVVVDNFQFGPSLRTEADAAPSSSGAPAAGEEINAEDIPY